MRELRNEKQEKREKLTERWEENKLRAYFLRVLGKYDFRDENRFVAFCKWLIFIVLVIVEALIVLYHLDNFEDRGGLPALIVILSIEFLLTLSEILKLFVFKKEKGRFVFYAVDALAACCFMFFTSGIYPVVIYMLVLTEFYIGAEKTPSSVALLCVSLLIYEASYFIKTFLLFPDRQMSLIPLLTESVGALFSLGLHFVVVNVGLAFYRQFLRLDKTLKELDASKRELEKAYAVVAEVTALEERQRIAKEIHDTAGHSVTTVIMQTEAAKLILDSNPEEAKAKLVAANLQAKHALEELRDSVHLLSGSTENKTLKEALEGIIHESTDGTGITIRSEIVDVAVSEAKYRFLCNSLKEGISNGLRHGGATAFWFELKLEGDKLHFLLSDNGRGMDVATSKLGFGLTTMQERARSLGGEVCFESEIEDGFELRLSLPIQG